MTIHYAYGKLSIARTGFNLSRKGFTIKLPFGRYIHFWWYRKGETK